MQTSLNSSLKGRDTLTQNHYFVYASSYPTFRILQCVLQIISFTIFSIYIASTDDNFNLKIAFVIYLNILKRMINNRNAISYPNINKKSIRPQTGYPSTSSKPSRLSLRIDSIITSLEKNVKDLKNHYHRDEEFKGTLSLEKGKSKFRLKKIRNGSQSHIARPHSKKNSGTEDLVHSDLKDRQLTDIFQIKTNFSKLYGRETNNIIELYQYYKKNIEKRDKSTRILASIDMSNPNMGLSLEVYSMLIYRGKESLGRQQQGHFFLKNEKEVNPAQIISQKLESSSKFEPSNKLDHTGNSRTSKPSTLASDLLSKGLYNMANVANLMFNKKYKLTKQKQESFQKVLIQREKLKSLKIEHPKQNNLNFCNMNTKKEINSSEVERQEQKGLNLEGNNSKVTRKSGNKNSSGNMLDLNVSFSESKQNIAEFSVESTEKNKKNIPSQQNAKNDSSSEAFEVSSIKKISEAKPKKEQNLSLEESPIVPQKEKAGDFSKSKYYVQPIPVPKKKMQQQLSITLKSNSRIIDIDLLPFDL